MRNEPSEMRDRHPHGEARVSLLIGQSDLRSRLSRVGAWIFDWDGVFNAGVKSGAGGSPFSEADSMGVNLLRFGTWLLSGEQMPVTVIVSGEQNETAAYFAAREHFDYCFRGFSDKRTTLDRIEEDTGKQRSEMAFFFDDVLDLSAAAQCGLRLCIGRFEQDPFETYVAENGLADVRSGVRGGEHAVRQVAEYLLDFQDVYTRVLNHRISYSEVYRKYLDSRNQIQTIFVESTKLKGRVTR